MDRKEEEWHLEQAVLEEELQPREEEVTVEAVVVVAAMLEVVAAEKWRIFDRVNVSSWLKCWPRNDREFVTRGILWSAPSPRSRAISLPPRSSGSRTSSAGRWEE